MRHNEVAQSEPDPQASPAPARSAPKARFARLAGALHAVRLVRACAVVAALGGASALGQVFSNNTAFTIPTNGVASTYPSTINVAGVGTPSRVTLRITIDHDSLDDVDILLVGPTGLRSIVLSDGGGSCTLVCGSRTYTFEAGANTYPDSQPFGVLGQPSSGVYAPVDYVSGDVFPAPAPAGPHTADFSALTGASANGNWSLYVFDDGVGTGGTISSWSLTFNSSAPTTIGDAWTYQGQLSDANGPINGSADFQFTLWEDDDSTFAVDQIGGVAARNSVALVNGVFTVQDLDFGALDTLSAGRWLQIAVRSPAGSGSFTTLSPRTKLRPAPFALASQALVDPTGAYQPAVIVDSSSNAIAQNNFTVGGTLFVTGAANITANVSVTGSGTGIPMVIDGGNDTNLATDAGDLVLGSPTGTSIAIDNNEIQARNAGAAETLFLNFNGGAVNIATSTLTGIFNVSGAAAKTGGGSWSVLSDERLKHDITPLEGSLDKLLSLRGVSFVYNDPEAINELPGRRTGMVAQEVERVFPEWVQQSGIGYKMLTFTGFEALTVEALRDLKLQKDRELAEIREENSALKARLDKLEAALAAPAK
jgi:subtilisin-like proprotein convertase family protein